MSVCQIICHDPPPLPPPFSRQAAVFFLTPFPSEGSPWSAAVPPCPPARDPQQGQVCCLLCTHTHTHRCSQEEGGSVRIVRRESPCWWNSPARGREECNVPSTLKHCLASPALPLSFCFTHTHRHTHMHKLTHTHTHTHTLTHTYTHTHTHTSTDSAPSHTVPLWLLCLAGWLVHTLRGESSDQATVVEFMAPPPPPPPPSPSLTLCLRLPGNWLLWAGLAKSPHIAALASPPTQALFAYGAPPACVCWWCVDEGQRLCGLWRGRQRGEGRRREGIVASQTETVCLQWCSRFHKTGQKEEENTSWLFTMKLNREERGEGS